MSDTDFPDIFADGVNVSTGPYGVAFTFYLSDPLHQPSPGSPPGAGRVVARVRVDSRLAEAMADLTKVGLSRVEDKGTQEGEK